MKTRIYLPFIALALMATSCNSKKEAAQKGGIQIANLDQTANPRNDFYQYACGGWMKANPLTDEYSRFGSFDQLAENNRSQIKSLIEDLAHQQSQPGSVAQKVGDLYNIAMDSAKLNADGVAPIKGYLEKIEALDNRAVLSECVAGMHRDGFGPFFGLYVGADDMNSSMNMAQLYQGGLSLGEREYYLDNDDRTKEIRAKFEEHVVKMFQLAGFTEEEARKAATDVMKVETRLAETTKSAVELRDPHANYNKITVAQLKKEVPGINWDAYFTTIGLKDLQEVNVGQMAEIKTVADLLTKENMDVLKSYLQWNVINTASSYLSDDFVAQNFDFYGKTLSGTKEMQPRWKRAVSSVNGVLGEAVGQMYTDKYFPAAAKERMVKLVSNLQKALGERIQGLEWMSAETKAKALEKLAAFHVKIGYPDKWKDYSSLEIKNDSYWENIVRSNHFDYDKMIAKAGKPVDKDEWLMTPQTVNAYYNPTTNEICFPAGILQYPFFDMNADDACNYGAIGVVIGHEMTHGFDDQGRQYDKDGNLKDWWTAEDAKNFQERAQVLVDYFSNIQVLPDLKANGELTLGENIADHGGLQVAYQALQKAMAENPLGNDENGFTPAQRFFLSYANVWAGNVRDEQIRLQTKSDPHSLGRWRVNAALPHIGMWYEAFDVKEGDALYLPVEQRASIW
ncbi:M13 family metallopeptidase [Butyricimonas paravirosa]|mgnify:FL=1|uniref:M13 family metallopeptidase n=1 Tax=Butyricimonas paravirosa TaxID=1472417 RepID=UPI00210D9D9A|nr:M13 family metallopeptidase [Butyricimonas paravirosa]MCQ4873703.1 M13 family metallopeptidase [Butyricimonas paravirosa]